MRDDGALHLTAQPDFSRIPPDAFARALAFTLQWEHGKSDHPADHGGRTLDGITQVTYATYRAARRLPRRDVFEMTDPERYDIYRRNYWDAVRGDDLAAVSDRMAMCVFDSAVNHGVGTASRLLQRTAQAEPDGVIGKVTIACLRLRLMKLGPAQLLTVFLERRAGLYKAILLRDPSQGVFRKGWRNRINALATVVGVESPWED